VPTPEPFLLNKQHVRASAPGPRGSGEVRRFHRTLPGYAETPLVSLPTVAAASNLRAVLVKDESSRLGLPAFKMLGASWAVHRALQERRADLGQPRLVTATDGNHGRAVARMAKLLGLPATVVVPRGVSEKAISLIREEGATVEVLDASYDDAVRHAHEMARADDNALLVQDTSWPGYEDVPQWIVDGYATLFDEAADQAAERGLDIDLLVVPAGVGSLAHAAVLFARSRPSCTVVTVEPTVAACISASLAADELTVVPTGETSMAGLNCGTPAYLAWPDLRTGLAGAATVDDQMAKAAMAELAALGVDSGPCGSASLAALHTLATGPARAALGLTPESVVLLLNTEGFGSGS
jgi:diaminopropionate ammonia-lyase